MLEENDIFCQGWCVGLYSRTQAQGSEYQVENAHLSSQYTNAHCVRRYCICMIIE